MINACTKSTSWHLWGKKKTFLFSRNMAIKCSKNMMDTATQQKKSGSQLLVHANKNGNEVAKEHLNKAVTKARKISWI